MWPLFEFRTSTIMPHAGDLQVRIKMRMKALLAAQLVLAAFVCGNASATLTMTFSTSGTDPNAGSSLFVNPGSAGNQLFVWAELSGDASVEPYIEGLGLDITADNGNVVATSHVIENPVFQDIPGLDRWNLAISNGTLNDSGVLVNDSLGAALPGLGGLAFYQGIQNGDGPVLHSVLTFDVIGGGTTELGFERGIGNIASNGAVPGLDFRTATVVASAVPEPSSFAMIACGLAATAFQVRRRKLQNAKSV
ncbi:PEP-CTERM sorting domain-containing protein [Crateriforma conspicua]|uniref:PEP-CTERM sorting domain-containing protein n=1 Tax=Crateriforma conspicua TaxID=2527996 RepID=UPI0011AA9DB0|nr:PEP-CTERM sorting domain-containing protein [Crateriforma conspicua]